MPAAIRTYVKIVDRLCSYVGHAAMVLVLVMICVLLLDAVTRNVIRMPLHWCVEFAQFTLTAYYFMGGPYSLMDDSHVRMDLVYGRLSERGKHWMDLATIGCMMFFLAVLLAGSVSSLQYAILTNEKRFSIWNPSMIPIKALMVACIVLMLLQTVSMVFKHVAALRGEDLK
ncbi:MAG: TRAP transporter small permease subunit [Hyphomicrobium sp.]|nr:TRAP transporter small permease subunit [Hyphomicrobium sp.]